MGDFYTTCACKSARNRPNKIKKSFSRYDLANRISLYCILSLLHPDTPERQIIRVEVRYQVGSN